MRYIMLLLTLSFLPFLRGQTTEADLKARLVKRPLYLRGMWGDDKLIFDSTGRLSGTFTPISFTLAGVEIKSAKLTPTSLILNGQRVGIEFNKDVPKRVALREWIRIEIARPGNGDFTDALSAIFAQDLADLVVLAPDYWQPYVAQHLLAAANTTGAMAPTPPGPTSLPQAQHVSGSVLPPRLLNDPVQPSFTDAARGLRYSGMVLVNFVLDKTGKPTRVTIAQPIGLGLDERAVAAVSHYSFKPATQNGVPVTIELRVEVNFQTY